MRAELLGQLVAAQFEIEAALKEAGGNVGAAKEGVAQLELLNALQRQIGSANPTALAAMRSGIIATVSAAQAVAHQTRTGADDSKIANLTDVTNNTRKTLRNLADELFEQKKLDPYLQFQSADDEAEYRKREAERKAYIDRELAKGTPEGALNANLAFKAQLKDAGAHGAEASPDYAAMLAKAEEAERGLRSAMPNAPTPSVEQPKSGTKATELDDIMAAFRDAGVSKIVIEDKPPAHGLAQGKLAEQIKGV